MHWQVEWSQSEGSQYAPDSESCETPKTASLRIRAVKALRKANLKSAKHVKSKKHWSEDEHKMFVESVKEHGRDWSRIAHLIQDKTEQ